MRTLAVIVCCCAAAFAAGGPASKTAASKSAAHHSTAGLTDAQIEAAIKAKLAKSKVAADKFQVRVQNGVATWEGHTDVIQHKGVATRMAKSAGAKSVVNNIQISAAAREKAAGNLQEGRRRVQVKRGETRDQRPPQ